MDYEYCMQVVKVQKENLRKAEAVGNVAAIRSYAASIARNLRKAALAAPSQAAALNAEAAEYDGYAERYLESRGTREEGRKEKDTREERPRPVPRTSPSEKGKSKEKRDYAEYDFGVGELVVNKKAVSFDDIVGMEDVKREIHRTLIYPLRHPEIYASYGLRPGGYTLLWGPPGTGKTTFARAVANEIDVPFLKVVCTDLVNKYLGETAHEIRRLFKSVREFIEKENVPIVLFLDEIDAIGKRRESNDVSAGAAVPTLLQELEGFDTTSENIIIIAATNVRSMLDDALTSRFNSIFVPLPDLAARKALFELKAKEFHLRQEELARLDFNEAARVSEGVSGRDIHRAMEAFAGDIASSVSKETIIDEPLNDRLLRHVFRFSSKKD